MRLHEQSTGEGNAHTPTSREVPGGSSLHSGSEAKTKEDMGSLWQTQTKIKTVIKDGPMQHSSPADLWLSIQHKLDRTTLRLVTNHSQRLVSSP